MNCEARSMPPKLRRANGEGTVYERRDGRWEGAYTLPNGKRRRLYARTRQEASRRLTAALRDQQLGLAPTDNKLTVERFLARWLQEVARPGLRPMTFDHYESMIRLHLLPELGRVRLARLTPADVQALLNRKSAAGLAPKTVAYIRGVLRTALGRAMKWGLVTRNVAALVDPPRRVHHEMRTFSPEELGQLLSAIESDRLHALYVVAMATGLRQGELLGLQWPDVELDAARLTIRHSLQRVAGRPQLVEPKTGGSRRTVALNAPALAALREHRALQARERLQAPPGKWHDSEFVFTTPIGTPLDGPNLTKAFQRHLEAARLPRLRFHDLRHTCASLLIAEGVPLKVVAELLGHSTIKLTADTYGHVQEEAQRAAVARLDKVLGVTAI